MNTAQTEFYAALMSFIQRTERMPRFRGQTQALSALRRISRLAVFN